MGGIILVVALCFAAVMGRPQSVVTPDQRLDMLPPDELDMLLNEFHYKHLININNDYEEAFKNHELHRRNIFHEQQRRRQRRSATDHFINRDGSVPEIHFNEVWHNFIVNSGVNNRQVVAIDNITKEEFTVQDNIKIVKTFPLPLNHLGISALFKNEDSIGYIIDSKQQKLESIIVFNDFTLSRSGCSCTNNTEVGQKTCACCILGGCLCNDYGIKDTCVQCGMEKEHCVTHGHQILKIDSATAFTYHLDSDDPDMGFRTMFLTTFGTEVKFYNYHEEILMLKKLEDGRKSMSFGNNFTQIAYADTFVDYKGDLIKKRFMFTFEAGKNGKQLYHEIEIDPILDILRIRSTRVWKVTGEFMKTIQNNGHIYILLCDHENEINIYEFAADKYRNFDPWFIHKFKLEETPLEIEIFTSHFDQNLLITMPNEARIYKIKGNRFDHLQTLKPEIPITKFENIVPIKMKGCGLHEILLAVQGTDAYPYVWNGYNESYSMIEGIAVPTDIFWSQAVSFANQENSGEVVVPGKSSVLTMHLYGHLEELQNPVIVLYDQVHNHLEKIEEEFLHQQGEINKTIHAIDHSITESSNINGTITINGSVEFLEDLHTHDIDAPRITIDESIAGENITNEEYLRRLTQLKMDSDELYSTVINLENVLSDAVPKNISEGKIIGSKIIKGGNVNISHLDVGDLDVILALQNEEEFPLQEKVEKLVRKDFPGIVKGRKTFPEFVTLFRLETDFLDDIPVSDLVTNDGEESIAGAVFEKGLFVKGNLSFSENATAAGKNPNQIVCATNRIHRLGRCRFNSTLRVPGNLMVQSGIVDGVQMDDLAHKTLKKNSQSVLDMLLNITQFIIVEGNIRTESIMGVNFTEFLDHVVLKNKPSNISGHLTYEADVNIQGNLIVNGLINNKKFPVDYPLVNDTHIDFGNKTFGLLEVDDVNVKGFVDEKKTEEFLTKTTNQTVNDTKVFDCGIDVYGDLDVGSGIIDGLNMSNLHLIDERNFSDIKTIVFKRNLKVESLNFTGNLNGADFKEVIDDLVFCDEKKVLIDSVKTFNNLAVRATEFYSTVNNEKVSEFITTNIAQTINGQITFSEVTHFRSLDVNGMVDGVDIDLLYGNALYLDKSDQVVTGKKMFSDNITMISLKVHQEINDIDFNRAVTISGDQQIDTPQNFTNANFENLYITNIKLGEPALIDGVDIDDFLKRRLTTIGAQSVQGNIVIECPVNGSTLHSEQINGYDLDDLVNNVVVHNANVTINSDIIFSSMEVLGQIKTKNKGGANGFSLAEVASNAFSLDGSENNMEYAHFEYLEISDLSINGLVDGVNIEDLINDAVFDDDYTDITVTGNKSFTSGMHAQRNIEALTVNGLNYSSNLLLNRGEQIITGEYTFNNMTIMKNVFLNGSFNEITMEEFEDDATERENLIFNDEVVLTGPSIINWIDVIGLFNNFNLYDVYNDAVCDDTSEISGKIIFDVPPEFSNLNIENLNGVYFESVLSDAVFKNSDACMFEDDIKIDGVITVSNINVNETNIEGNLDRTDYESLFTEAIYLSKDHKVTAHWVFAGGSVINGNLDVALLKDIPVTEYLTSHTPQIITHDLKFDQLAVDNVTVLGTVNGLNLTEEYKNTLFGTGDEIVTGKKTFTGYVIVEGDVHITNKAGTDVKIDISEETIRIDQTNHTFIQGPIVFTAPLIAESFRLDGLVNSVDLHELFGNAWYKDQPTNFTDPMVFEGHVITEGGLNKNISHSEDYDIKGIHELGSQLLHRCEELVKEIDIGFEETCGSTVLMYQLMENSIYDAEYLHFVTSFKSPGVHRSSTTFTMNGMIYFVVSWQDNCYSSIYRWDTNNSTFIHEQDFESGSAHNWIAIPYTNPDFVQLMMSAGWETDNCNIKNTTIWGVETDGNSIVVNAIQTLPPSKGVSVMDANDRLKLNLYNENEKGIIGYQSNEKGIFEFEERRRDIINKYVFGYDSYGSEIGFEVGVAEADSLLNNSSVIAFENGQLLSIHTLNNVIMDALALEQDGKVFLMLLQRETILDRAVLSEELFYIVVYEYDFDETSFELLSYEEVHSSGSLVTFTAGNEASRLLFVTFIQDHGPVVVYTLLGETLKLWTELPIFVPTWILPFNNREANGYYKPYLLLGWNDTQEVIVLTMEMRGFTVPQYGESCHIPKRDMAMLEQYHSFYNDTRL